MYPWKSRETPFDSPIAFYGPLSFSSLVPIMVRFNRNSFEISNSILFRNCYINYNIQTIRKKEVSIFNYLGRSELDDNPTATHCLQNCLLYGTDHITDKTRFRDPPIFHLTTPRVPDIDESGTTIPAVWLPGSTELGPIQYITISLLLCNGFKIV